MTDEQPEPDAEPTPDEKQSSVPVELTRRAKLRRIVVIALVAVATIEFSLLAVVALRR